MSSDEDIGVALKKAKTISLDLAELITRTRRKTRRRLNYSRRPRNSSDRVQASLRKKSSVLLD